MIMVWYGRASVFLHAVFRVASAFAFFLIMIRVLSGAMAAETEGSLRLLMVEEVGCRFCAAWDADIGQSYGASAEGRFAPLVRVKRNAPELAGLKPAIYTPTFILMRGRHEFGRIIGYPGPHYFWVELGVLLEKAGYTSSIKPLRTPG